MDTLTPDCALQTLLSRIQSLPPRQRPALVAIDGMAASGKSTLAAQLEAALDGAQTVHMDDFFLPEPLRAQVRSRLLANADIERFDREVLTPLDAGKDAIYRPFVCHPVPGLLAPVCIPANTRAVIIEGAYSLHPLLASRYDLRVLMTISTRTQRSRILARNGETMLHRFTEEWIPLENRHSEAHRLHAVCDVRIDIP